MGFIILFRTVFRLTEPGTAPCVCPHQTPFDQTGTAGYLRFCIQEVKRRMGVKASGIQIQSVARAMDILNSFRHESELGISELSAEMGLNKSTIYGLVNTLTGYGFLEQDENTKKYRLGMTLYEYGALALARVDIRAEAKACCAELLKKYPATIHLATHSAGAVIYLEKIDREDVIIRASSIGGVRVPMYCTGVGKAMLAYLPESYFAQYISFPLKSMTVNTITDRDALLKELAEVRMTGLAYDREEIELGVSCIAAPVFQQDGNPELAVSVSFSNGRIRDIDQNEVAKDLLQCTRKLSARLGYRA